MRADGIKRVSCSGNALFGDGAELRFQATFDGARNKALQISAQFGNLADQGTAQVREFLVIPVAKTFPKSPALCTLTCCPPELFPPVVFPYCVYLY